MSAEQHDRPIDDPGLIKFEKPSYYFGLWAKHVTQYLDATGASIPQCVVEIGPGASLGAGLSALLTGARRYFAFDLVKHAADATENVNALQTITDMLRKRTSMPNARGFPNYQHLLNDDGFPERFFTEEILSESLTSESLKSIRSALLEQHSEHEIRYLVPWEAEEVYGDLREQVDFLFSHSVMEHVDDIDQAYRIFGELCKRGGGMSHQIDFRSHGFTRPWNAYRTIPDEEWAKLCASKPYAINREPLSRHIELAEKYGFRIVRLLPRGMPNSIARSRLTPRFRRLDDADLTCAGALIQARRV